MLNAIFCQSGLLSCCILASAQIQQSDIKSDESYYDEEIYYVQDGNEPDVDFATDIYFVTYPGTLVRRTLFT